MKKIILGLAMVLFFFGVFAGVFVWRTEIAQEAPQVRNVSEEEPNAESWTDAQSRSEGQLSSEGQTQPGGKLSSEGQTSSKGQLSSDEQSRRSADETPAGQVNRLAYERLDAEARTAYEEMRQACEQHMEQVELTTINEEVIATAYEALTCDYGGFFWVNGYTYTLRTLKGQVKKIDFAPSYTFSQAERQLYQKQVDEAAENYLAQISMDASDYEKVKYVYEMLIRNVKYNMDSRENQNILSVFLYGESVCSGYACAAQYLLTLLDVPCMTVYGVSEGENHAWNLVYIDGEPYFMDATWGSTVSEGLGECSYAYLNLTSQDIQRTHTVHMSFELPECTAKENNYYVREGRYFTVFDDRKVAEVLASSYEAGESSIAIKLASDEVYQQVFQTFIANMKVADCCEGLSSLTYVENKEMRVLTFLWRQEGDE